MPKETTIELTSPIMIHGGQTSTWVLREPKARDYFAAGGKPYEFTRPTDGTEPIMFENAAMVLDYIERCTVAPGAEFLVQVSLPDTLRLKDAVLGFFSEASRIAYPTPATSSSSGPGSSPPPNAAS